MLPSGLASAAIPLSVGANVINTVVTAQDGVTTQNYALTITRLPSADATLSNIIYSPTIVKTTIAGTNFKDYVATVGNTFTSVTVTAALHDAAASIKVNGMPVVSDTASAVIPLNVGANVINTAVTAQDGVTIKNYAITITRLPSNNATLSNITYSPAITKTTVAGADYRDYSATVVNTFTSITVTPVLTDPGASIKVNGVPVVSGNASAQIPLSVGANIINAVVTAQDGITIKNYSITITRQASTDATLSNITYSPAITKTTVAGADFRDYAATVANTFTSIAVTPVLHDGGASVKVNGVAVISGNTSALVPLNVGVNIINTVVTAQDGITTKSYSLSITRKEAGLAMQYGQQELQIISDKLTVHQNVSPNGDGNSDVLVIDGIADYPENKMQLMSRNGALIYEVKGYNNTTKAFDGHSSTNGKMQQAGTYFYSLEYKDGNEVKYRTGFIVLKY